MSRKLMQQIFTYVCIISFGGSTVYGAMGAINSAVQQPQANANQAASKESQLQTEEKGYELVLKREPDNQTALRGLVEVRLQMKNTKGAIAPLEKLVKLHPEQQEYKMLLAQVKKQVGKSDR